MQTQTRPRILLPGSIKAALTGALLAVVTVSIGLLLLWLLLEIR